jgi:hypothetical protein
VPLTEITVLETVLPAVAGFAVCHVKLPHELSNGELDVVIVDKSILLAGQTFDNEFELKIGTGKLQTYGTKENEHKLL